MIYIPILFASPPCCCLSCIFKGQVSTSAKLVQHMARGVVVRRICLQGTCPCQCHGALFYRSPLPSSNAFEATTNDLVLKKSGKLYTGWVPSSSRSFLHPCYTYSDEVKNKRVLAFCCKASQHMIWYVHVQATHVYESVPLKTTKTRWECDVALGSLYVFRPPPNKFTASFQGYNYLFIWFIYHW
jgi:hypothetical protein